MFVEHILRIRIFYMVTCTISHSLKSLSNHWKDAFEYITVPGAKHARTKISQLTTGKVEDSELLEVQAQIEEAKKLLAEKQAEVEKIVNKVEDEIKEEKAEEAGETTVKEETPEEKKEEEELKEKIVEAVVEKELNLNKWCGGCQYGQMPFTCAKRVSWMMEAYGLNEDLAKEATMNKCGYRRMLRGDFVQVGLNWDWYSFIRKMGVLYLYW